MSRNEFERKYGDDYREINYHTKKGMGLLLKVILTIFAISVLLSGLTMALKPAFLYGDRVITKTSYQYTEGKAQEMLTMYNDYAGLGSRIAEAEANGQSGLVTALETQRGAIKIQMCNLAQIATTDSAIPPVVRAVCNIQ